MGLTAGILIILISIAHSIYGEKKQIPDLKKITNDAITIGSLRIMIHQGGLLLLAVGIVQVLVAINYIQLNGISAYFPLGIVLINTITSFIIALIFHREIFKITLPQFIIFAAIIALQFLALN